ncbi:MAG: DUF4298 domain-containing protein [Lachnospiraceae bacterium]|nr:DUF4298 domain-containing protein [Lachnospiraceae bacterium]MBP3577089.1 DUF4298 domain-containing protein [Lachnospiraceae bacterium]
MENKTGIIDRIQQMEQYMDEVAEALRNAPDKLKSSDELRKKIATLTDYMDSGQWLADYEADERGELPKELKRGVLSQDALYNLLCEIKENEETSLNEFTINEMLTMQKTLQEHYKTIWEPIGPETGQNKLLWMIGEIGEVIDIVKKNGGTKACSDTELRKDLVEELADVLMYYNDVLLCYGISAEELKKVYTEKFERNMTRWKA